MEELAPDSSMYYITCALVELMDTGRAHKGPRLAPCLRPATASPLSGRGYLRREMSIVK